MKNRDRYISAYERAKSNEQRERDLYYGIPNTDPAFSAFLKNGPSIETCAVNDYIEGRFCPPK